MSLERLCALLAIGDEIRRTEVSTPNFNRCLLQASDHGVFETILLSGYHGFFRSDFLEDKGCAESRQKKENLRLRYNQPLKLLGLSANVVRTRLQPNAVMGENILIARGLIPPVLRHVITLGLSKEDFRTQVLRKRITPTQKH